MSNCSSIIRDVLGGLGTKRREDLLKERIRHIDFDSIDTVEELMEAYKDSSIQSRALAACSTAYEMALRDETRPTMIMGLAGPLIAGGLRKVIVDMVRFGMVDVIVSVGAIPYQDFYQAQGHGHYKCSPGIDDLLLREHFIDRIYDTLVDEKMFRETDACIGKIAESIDPRVYSSREFMDVLGSRVDDRNSILFNAHRYGVPIFVPALNDSSIGIGLTGAHVRSREEGRDLMRIDPIRDNWELTQIKIQSEKTGVLYIGGGVPKNFIQQTEVAAETMGYDRGGHHYAVQITTDVPFWGGLSGCTFEEAQSWGKINREATKGVAYVEATLGMSLMVGYLLQRKVWKGRDRLAFKWNEDTLESVERVPFSEA